MSGPSYVPFLLKGLGCRQREWVKLEGENAPQLPTKHAEENEFTIHVLPSYYNVCPSIRLFPSTWHMDKTKKEAHIESTGNLNGRPSAPDVKGASREIKPVAKVDFAAPKPRSEQPDIRPTSGPETPLDVPQVMAGPIAPPIRNKSAVKKSSRVVAKDAPSPLIKEDIPSKPSKKLQSTQERKEPSTKPSFCQNPSEAPKVNAMPAKISNLNGLAATNLNHAKTNATQLRYKLCRSPAEPSLKPKMVTSQVPMFPSQDTLRPPPQLVLQKLQHPPASQHTPPSRTNRGDNASRLSDSLERMDIEENGKSKKRVAESNGNHNGSHLKRAKSTSGIEKPSTQTAHGARSAPSARPQQGLSEDKNPKKTTEDNANQPVQTQQQRSRRLPQEPKMPPWAENVTKDLLSALCVFAKKSSILSWSRLKPQDITMFLKQAEGAFPVQQQAGNGPDASAPAAEREDCVQPMDISEPERRKTSPVGTAAGRRRPVVRSSLTGPGDDVRNIKDLIANWNKLVVEGDPKALEKMTQTSDPLLKVCFSLRDDPEYFSDANLVQLFSHFANATMCTEYLALTTERMIGENDTKPSLAVRRFCRWSCQLSKRLEEYFDFCWKLRSDHKKRIKLRDTLFRISDVWRDAKAKGTRTVIESIRVLRNCANKALEKSESDGKTWKRIFDDTSTTRSKLRSIYEQTQGENGRQASTSFDAEAENQTGRSSSKTSKKISARAQAKRNDDAGSSEVATKAATPTISNRERAELALAKANRKPENKNNISAAQGLAPREPNVPADQSAAHAVPPSQPESMVVDAAIVSTPARTQTVPTPQAVPKRAPPLRSAPLPLPVSASATLTAKPGPSQANGNNKPTSMAQTTAQGQDKEAQTGLGITRQKRGILRGGPKPSESQKKSQTVAFSPGIGLVKSGLGGFVQRIPRENIETLFSDQGVETPSTLLDPNNEHQREAVEERIREMSIGSVLAFFGVAKAFTQGIHESGKNLHEGITDPIEPPVTVRLFDARELDRVARMPHNGAC